MIERILNDFDIDQIANSGQCFRFHRVGDKSYNLIAGTHLLNIQQNGRTVRFDCDEDEFNAIWRPYFDLDADYGRCKAAVAKRDTYLQNAVAYGGGLRILRQDLWETILCFIISQQNNIARITKCVENLCSLFGETCYNKSEQVYNSIPTAERLAACTPEVAECICLFALHHIDAFPIDTHIQQMLDTHYPKGFPLKRYKGFAGVMQQYAFYYELSLKG